MKQHRFCFSCFVERSAPVLFGLLFVLLLTHTTMASQQELQAVVQGNGLFTKQLYNVLAKKEGNVFFSPISAHSVLSMAYAGSKGATYDAFTKALNVADHNLAAKGYNSVFQQINNISDVQLSIANKIYVKEGYQLKPAFQEITEKQYLSGVEAIDFTKAKEATKNINNWVEDKTNSKIKDLVQESDFDSLTRLVLLNAIYFKGTWGSKFDANKTRTDKFYINDADSVDVDMMENKSKYSYKEDEQLDAQIIELPYSNPEISMIIVLPNKRNGIAELEQKLAEVDLTKITDGMYKTDVIVRLPRFKIETKIELNEPLTEMGLGAIFSDNADFSEMLQSPEPLKVSKVLQKAFIEVNEEGTEAAAATKVLMMVQCSLISLQPPKWFTADHPFLLLLQGDNQKGSSEPTLFFVGRIAHLRL